ncbi:unnamed protein product [Spirodela intermedia]|uniref:Uncharacterized protein n=2 Tax=Spirodela intermedia TaxID=51605 RepID=A0A7I8IV31_SPIIN|nr:unnamed protein product [Spirodela intermedia]CAA6661482.1 unnamed protein product [Spirodela intermedia]CAA7397845.1 unnamed protein product [Spirodela intermedia]
MCVTPLSCPSSQLVVEQGASYTHVRVGVDHLFIFS